MFEDLQSDQSTNKAKPEPKGTPQASGNAGPAKQPPMPSSSARPPKPEPASESVSSSASDRTSRDGNQGEPEDILADVEGGPAPSSSSARPPKPSPKGDIGPAKPLTGLPGAEAMAKQHRSGNSKKLYYIIGAIIIAVIIVFALVQFNASLSYDEYENFVNDPLVDSQNNTNEPEDTAEPVDEPKDTAEPVDEPDLADTLDDDSDGIPNDQELAIGTDPFNPDSDNDGLFDKEEVVTYKTDPLNEDSDGDGFIDGAEVTNGYNPSGPGELLQLPIQ